MKAKHVESIEKQKGNNREAEEAKDDAAVREKVGEQQQSVSQRPSRRAKTKEAVLKHLNRDVELLVGEKPDKKASVKKTSGGAGQAGAAQVNGSGGGTAGTHNTGSKYSTNHFIDSAFALTLSIFFQRLVKGVLSMIMKIQVRPFLTKFICFCRAFSLAKWHQHGQEFSSKSPDKPPTDHLVQQHVSASVHR